MIQLASLAIIGGLLSFLSPCVLPLAPLYIAYFSGVNNPTESFRKRTLFINLISFFIGFTIIYLLLGISFSFAFAFIQNYYNFQFILGIIMILFAFQYWKIIKIQFLYSDTRQLRVRKFNLFSSFVFGVLFAFGWSPCLGPLLGNVIVLATNISGFMGKIFVLLMFCLGLIIPFSLLALMSVKFKKTLQNLKNYSQYIDFVSGLLLFMVGFWLILK